MLSRRGLIVLAGILAAGAAGVGWWRTQAVGAASAPAALQSGITGYLDDSGRLAEPPVGAPKRLEGGARDFAQFTYESTPDGGTVVNFNDAWHSTAVGHMNRAGRVGVQCVPGEGEGTRHAH